jgi:hypothetical protein
LGWTLSRIEAATGIRRETISGYPKAAAIAVRSRGRPSESILKPANFRGGVHRLRPATTGHQGGGVQTCGNKTLCLPTDSAEGTGF